MTTTTQPLPSSYTAAAAEHVWAQLTPDMRLEAESMDGRESWEDCEGVTARVRDLQRIFYGQSWSGCEWRAPTGGDTVLERGTDRRAQVTDVWGEGCGRILAVTWDGGIRDTIYAVKCRLA